MGGRLGLDAESFLHQPEYTTCGLAVDPEPPHARAEDCRGRGFCGALLRYEVGREPDPASYSVRSDRWCAMAVIENDPYET